MAMYVQNIWAFQKKNVVDSRNYNSNELEKGFCLTHTGIKSAWFELSGKGIAIRQQLKTIIHQCPINMSSIHSPKEDRNKTYCFEFYRIILFSLHKAT